MLPVSTGGLRRELALKLRNAGVENAAHEAALLTAHVLEIEPGELLLRENEPVARERQLTLEALAERRLDGEPLQLILGEWAFMGLPMYVERGVLIPRQDTETLCEEALRIAAERGLRHALELGTGSGAVAVALAKLGALQVTATDISPQALALAGRNAQRNGVTLALLEGEWFAPLGEQRFDLIVSNPPYIVRDEIPGLMREVRDFEPHLALDGGADGLDAYRAIASKSKRHLRQGGALLLEVGMGQHEQVGELLLCNGFSSVWIVLDSSRIHRVVGACN